MTGNDVYKRAMTLLGYQNTDTLTNTENLLKRAYEVINQLCLDLKIPSLSKLSDVIMAEEKKQDALCYGTAMLLSLIEGDGAKNQIFASIYNAKRSAALSCGSTVEDKLPRWVE